MHIFSEERCKRSVRRIIFIATRKVGVCEPRSLTLREKLRLRVFENRVLRGIFGPKRDEGSGENYRMMISMICTRHQILFV
jgi:hypothetical protein